MSFVFFERKSGAVQFEVKAEEDGKIPEEQASGLLAMHCLVRGLRPDDYGVLVVPRKKLTRRVAARAEELLAAGRAIACPIALSRRKQEVLYGILQNFANKEIAARLNLSERTVKFHVSSLLAKFHVQGRVDLMREAGRVLIPGGLAGRIPTLEFPGEAEKSNETAPTRARSERSSWSEGGGLALPVRNPLPA